MISGLSPASEGEILFEGRDVARLAPERICPKAYCDLSAQCGFDS